ncbi:hypothetical protein [Actinoplanes utahensis]|nr:hypothetical protein [Actinoplanes utahensis]
MFALAGAVQRSGGASSGVLLDRRQSTDMASLRLMDHGVDQHER